MRTASSYRCLGIWWLTVFVLPLSILANVESTGSQTEDKKETKRSRFGFPSPKRIYRSIQRGDVRLFETFFRPLEFREPIVSMPVEGRYGVGFYGWERFNPVGFDSSLIRYESGTDDIFRDIGISSRTGSFIELDAVQTNLSHLLFNKSYADLLTGFGVRYSSIYSLPTIAISDQLTISGPPEVPSSWGVDAKFSPSVIEGNIVSSLFMQWRPKWFLHFKYSYGFNFTRFYHDGGMQSKPYGTGRSSTVSLGLKYIIESQTAARYAWGLELRHIYHKVRNIRDPDGVTPITGFDLPSFGLFFTFGAFYGGKTTVGDVGKKFFLNEDYVSAKTKLAQFVRDYPDHTRVERARQLLEVCDERIPHQLYREGLKLTKRGEMDKALEKFVTANLTADDELRKKVRVEIEKVADFYLDVADTVYGLGKDSEAIRIARKAGAVSERGREAQRLLEGKVYFRQGKGLARRGFYPMALRKFAEALQIAPSLRDDIRRAQLDVVAGMLEDVNRAADEGSLKLALQSLRQVRKILGKPDQEMDEVIDRLGNQLALLDAIRVRQGIDASMDQAREEMAKKHAPRVRLGMLVAQIQAILGDPHQVVERVDEKNRNYQMWIYHLSDKEKRFLYFEDYVLYRIEQE